MNLYDLFFPDTAQATHLRKIADESEPANHARGDEAENLRWQNRQLGERITRLEGDVGSLALVLAAVLKNLDEKGHVTRDEVKEVIEKLDLIDSMRDGKISLADLGAGDFFESS
jgi:hypothetical protein